jgi:hypothetical protein
MTVSVASGGMTPGMASASSSGSNPLRATRRPANASLRTGPAAGRAAGRWTELSMCVNRLAGTRRRRRRNSPIAPAGTTVWVTVLATTASAASTALV